MSSRFLIILLLAISTNLKADCLEYGTHFVAPLGKSITNQSFFIIASSDTNTLSSILNGQYCYLKEEYGKTKILLTVVKVCRGYNMTQILLKPSTELYVGKNYGLYYFTTKSKQKRIEVATRQWLVKETGNSQLVWQGQPKIGNKYFRHNGCGPDAKVYFQLPEYDSSVSLIKAVIKNKSSGKESMCFLKSNSSILELGHNMCWGEFEFEKESGKDQEQYEITFYLLNNDGLCSDSSQTITFVQPTLTDM